MRLYVIKGVGTYATDNQAAVQDRDKRTMYAAVHSRAAAGSGHGVI